MLTATGCAARFHTCRLQVHDAFASDTCVADSALCMVDMPYDWRVLMPAAVMMPKHGSMMQKILPYGKKQEGGAPPTTNFYELLIVHRGLLVAPHRHKSFVGGASPTFWVIGQLRHPPNMEHESAAACGQQNPQYLHLAGEIGPIGNWQLSRCAAEARLACYLSRWSGFLLLVCIANLMMLCSNCCVPDERLVVKTGPSPRTQPRQ